MSFPRVICCWRKLLNRDARNYLCYLLVSSPSGKRFSCPSLDFQLKLYLTDSESNKFKFSIKTLSINLLFVSDFSRTIVKRNRMDGSHGRNSFRADLLFHPSEPEGLTGRTPLHTFHFQLGLEKGTTHGQKYKRPHFSLHRQRKSLQSVCQRNRSFFQISTDFKINSISNKFCTPNTRVVSFREAIYHRRIGLSVGRFVVEIENEA